MNGNLCKLAGGLSCLLIIAGCVAMGVSITSTKSSGVDRIPDKLGLFPLLSTPVPEHVRYPLRTLKTLSAKRIGDNVVIIPPVETRLSITQESQIMTGMISTQLSSYGFSLKELPVEIPPGDDDSVSRKKSKDRFVISLNLLEQLREEYDLQALIIGNAFFVVERRPGFMPEKRVISAHVKVIDVESLDVLAQVNLPYDEYGAEMSPVAEAIALELAKIAELVDE